MVAPVLVRMPSLDCTSDRSCGLCPPDRFLVALCVHPKTMNTNRAQVPPQDRTTHKSSCSHRSERASCRIPRSKLTDERVERRRKQQTEDSDTEHAEEHGGAERLAH